jgi:hypothetical protein
MKTPFKYLFIPGYLANKQFFLDDEGDSVLEKWVERATSNLKKNVRFGLTFMGTILAAIAHVALYIFLFVLVVKYLWILLLSGIVIATPMFIYWVVKD